MDPETWKGWNFKEWCALDPKDNRKIYYKMRRESDGHQESVHIRR